MKPLAAVALLVAAQARAASVRIEAPAASPGETVSLEVVLSGSDDGVASLSIDVGFEPSAPIRAAGARPDCRLAPEVRKPNSAFVYRPAGCAIGIDCNAVRAGITSFIEDTRTLPIPDGTVYACSLTVPPATPIGERIELELLRASVIDPVGRETDVTPASRGGFIEVVGKPECVGDCDGNGAVAIDELARAVAVELGRLENVACPRLDGPDGPGVEVDDVINAVRNAGLGCPSASRPR